MRPLCTLSLPIASLVLALTPRPADAQTVRTLVLEGDEIFGVGTVTDIEHFTVNDNGDWLVLVDTDAPTSRDLVLLRNGIPTVQEGDVLASPEGAIVSDMNLPSFNSRGDIAWVLQMDNLTSSGDTGCYLNSGILLQEGTMSSSTGFTPGTLWKSFNTVKMNETGSILCRGSVDDPAISTTGDAGIVLLEADEYGYLLTEVVVMKEGTAYGGLNKPVQSLGTKPHDLALNNKGDFMTFVDTTDSSNLDGNVFYNFTSVAREGTSAPVAGRKWNNLSSPRLDLNDFGDYVFTGAMDGDGQSNTIIILNGEKFVQEGDVVDGVAPSVVKNFFTAPVFVSNNGKVIWFGQFSASDTSRNKAIFFDEQIIAQNGVTRVGLRTLKSIRTTNEGFFVPPKGQYVIFTATLNDSTTGVFLLDLGTVARMESCYGNTGELIYDSGLPLIGNRVKLQLDKGQGPGVTPVLMLSTLPVVGWPPCGLDLHNKGELLIDVSANTGNPFFFTLGNPWNGTPVPMDIDIPDDTGLVGTRVYAQGLFWDIGDNLPEQNLLLTNGQEIIIAGP